LRNILFRGVPKRGLYDIYLDEHLFRTSEFVYGSLVFDDGQPILVGKVVEKDPEYINLQWWVSVVPESVGQFVGREDSKGVPIFEGDVITTANTSGEAEIKWDEEVYAFVAESPEGNVRLLSDCKRVMVMRNSWFDE